MIPLRPASFCSLLTRLRQDCAGAFAALFACILPALIGLAAIGVETGLWYTVARQDQSVADITAYGGALEIAAVANGALSGAQDTQVQNAVKADALTNGFDFTASANTTSTVSVPCGTSCTGDAIANASCVKVTLAHQQTPLLTAEYLKNAFTIRNCAVAQVLSTSACVSSVGNSGITFGMRGGPTVDTPGCTITSNSTSDDSISLAGGGTIDAYSIYTAGGISSKGSATLDLTAPATTGGKALTNPYAGVSVSTTITGFVMPTLPSSATTFPTNLPTPASSPPTNTHFAAAPSKQTQPAKGCDATSTSINSLARSCYTVPNLTITAGTFTSTKSPYYFTGPISITGSVTVASGVDVYVANGPLTITGGTLTVADNAGKGGGTKAPDTIYVDTVGGGTNGSLDASGGTITFTGDTGASADYAILVSGSSGAIKLGTATAGGGNYAFYGANGGGNLVLGAAGHTSSLGAANYLVNNGALLVANDGAGGTASFATTVANSATSKTTDLTVAGGNFCSVGGTGCGGTYTNNNLTFSGGSGTTYSFSVPAGDTYSIGRSNLGSSTYGFYGGGVTIAPPGGQSATMGVGTYYVDAGDLAFQGATNFTAPTSGNPTTIVVNVGNLTNNAAGTLTFNGSGATSQYNICNGGVKTQGSNSSCNSASGKGVSLSGPATFNAGTYYFLNGSSSGSGIALNSGTSTFDGAIYSIQNGGFAIASGATANWSASTTPCAPTGGSPPAGSCLYVANGGVGNSGTASFAAGDYYLYAPNGSGASFLNSGTMSLGSSGASTFYVNNGGGAFVNCGAGDNTGSCASPASQATLNFGAGTFYVWDGSNGSGSNLGGFSNKGALNFTGSATSTYSFFNGPSWGTGKSSGKCTSGANSTYGAMSLRDGSTSTLGQGTYYFVNGDLCINPSSSTSNPPTVTGSNVTLVLTGTSANGPGGSLSSNISTLQVPAATTATLTLPSLSCSLGTAGCYKGLLIYQDQNAALAQFQGNSLNCSANCNLLDGGQTMSLEGAIYIPQAAVDFNAQANGNCLIVIADEITFSGNPSLTSTGCSNLGVATLSVNAVRLTD